jgi:dihydroorotate dehydrogenase electron transfer subunit
MQNAERVQAKLVTGKVVSNTQVTEGHFQISLFCPHIAQSMVPGQFVQVRVDRSYDPLLLRPLAIYRARGELFDILFKVVGKGTALLAEKCVGDILNIIGPLGNGFPVDSSYQRAILIAGGIGVVPFVALAESIQDRQVIALIGASSQNGVVGEKDLLNSGAEVYIATEDGTAGHKGMVSELLEEVLLKRGHSAANSRIFACGPMPMLKVVAWIAKQHEIPAYVSLEERMACGVGACLGCVCKTISPDGKPQYKTVCVDGPVFSTQEIVWE